MLPNTAKCIRDVQIGINEKNTKVRACLDGLGGHGGLHLGHLDNLVLGSPEAREAGQREAGEGAFSGGTGTGGGTGGDRTGGDGTCGGRGGLVAHLGVGAQVDIEATLETSSS